MPDFHAVYVTKIGVPFIEKAESFRSEVEAIEAAANAFSPHRDNEGRIHYSPVRIETHDGKHIVLAGFEYIQILTPEELREITEQEQRQQQMMQGVPLPEESDE